MIACIHYLYYRILQECYKRPIVHDVYAEFNNEAYTKLVEEKKKRENNHIDLMEFFFLYSKQKQITKKRFRKDSVNGVEELQEESDYDVDSFEDKMRMKRLMILIELIQVINIKFRFQKTETIRCPFYKCINFFVVDSNFIHTLVRIIIESIHESIILLNYI